MEANEGDCMHERHVVLRDKGSGWHVRVLMGLEIGYEGYDGNERWMNEVGIKKWVAWWCRENGFNR